MLILSPVSVGSQGTSSVCCLIEPLVRYTLKLRIYGVSVPKIFIYLHCEESWNDWKCVAEQSKPAKRWKVCTMCNVNSVLSSLFVISILRRAYGRAGRVLRWNRKKYFDNHPNVSYSKLSSVLPPSEATRVSILSKYFHNCKSENPLAS